MSYDVYLLDPNDLDTDGDPMCVFQADHTSNTGPMWRTAGCDLAEFDGKNAAELGPAVARAIAAITADPEKYRPMEPANRWGTLPSTVRFLVDIWEACTEHPDTTVSISR